MSSINEVMGPYKKLIVGIFSATGQGSPHNQLDGSPWQKT